MNRGRGIRTPSSPRSGVLRRGARKRMRLGHGPCLDESEDLGVAGRRGGEPGGPFLGHPLASTSHRRTQTAVSSRLSLRASVFTLRSFGRRWPTPRPGEEWGRGSDAVPARPWPTAPTLQRGSARSSNSMDSSRLNFGARRRPLLGRGPAAGSSYLLHVEASHRHGQVTRRSGDGVLEVLAAGLATP